MKVRRVGPVLEAVQWLGPHTTEQPPWFREAIKRGEIELEKEHVFIHWDYLTLQVKRLDLIIQGEDGEIYHASFDEFVHDYMIVDEDAHVARASYVEMLDKEDKYDEG